MSCQYQELTPFWPALEEAARRDMGVFIISPNDKGGKLYTPPKKLVDLCAPLTPMQFNDLYCLARPHVHTLSIGAARPTDFDEHLAALAHYDRIVDGRDIWSLITGQPGARSRQEACFFYWGGHMQAVRSGPWKRHLPHSYPVPTAEIPVNMGSTKPPSFWTIY